MANLRSYYNHGDDSSGLGAICCEEPSATKQEFKDECDINRIMRQYQDTGLAESSSAVGRYGDFSSVGDFHAAQNVIAQASEQFESLPANVRDRFRNSPALFLEFIGDKANRAEARALGLLVDEPPTVPPVVSEPPVA